MCQLTCVSCQACNFFLFEPISSPSLPPPYPVVLTRLLHTMRRGRRYYYLLEGAVTGHLGLLIFRPRRTQGCSGCGQRVLTVRAQVWLAQGLFLFHHLFVWIAWMTGVCVFHPIISIVYCYPAPLVTLSSHPGLLLLPSTPIYSGHQIPSSSWPQSSLMLLCLPGFPASLFFLFHPAPLQISYLPASPRTPARTAKFLPPLSRFHSLSPLPSPFTIVPWYSLLALPMLLSLDCNHIPPVLLFGSAL